jgi:hypothetical protein
VASWSRRATRFSTTPNCSSERRNFTNKPAETRFDEGAAEIQPASPRLGFEQRLVLLLLAGAEEMHDLLPAGMQELCD